MTEDFKETITYNNIQMCNKCNGIGQIVEMSKDDNNNSYFNIHSCDTCKGKGYIENEIILE